MKETTNMKAVVVETPGKLVVKEIPLDPMPGPGQVQIRLRAAGICGSDVHVLHGRSAFASYPRILGHELAGEVCALGEGVQGLALGDHVVVDPLTACGHCYACRVGRYNVCRELKVLAAHVDGGFRQYFTVGAANVHKISPSVPWEHAACVEPYTIAAEATQRGELRADDAVLICGAGPIGATILQVVKRVGARALVLDNVQARLDAMLAMGADAVVNSAQQDVAKAVADFSGGEGMNLLFEATGSLAVLEGCINEWASPASRLVVLGFSSEPASIAPIQIMKREMDIRGSRLSCNKFDQVVGWVESGYVDPAKLISHVFPMEQADKAFEQIAEDPAGTMKVILSF